MKEILTYVIESLICGGVLTALYTLLLERRVKFAICRGYLLCTAVLSAAIPALKIPVWEGEKVYISARTVAVGDLSEITAETVDEAVPLISPENVCLAIYFAGIALMLSLLAMQLVNMHRLRMNGERVSAEDFELVRVRDRISSFSFFGTIFVCADTLPADLEIIIAHEHGHIRHRHSIERVAMELLKAALWWNPFVWIAARRLTEVQEYEADNEVINGGYDVSNYINTLLKHLFGYSPDIANGLRDSLTKKRLKMMTMRKGGRYGLLRTLATVPAVAALVTAFSFTAKAAETVISDGETAEAAVQGAEVYTDGEICRITGRVVDPSGNAIEGVIVRVDGSKRGTVTDRNGAFATDVPDNSDLVFEFVDYAAQTHHISKGGKRHFEVVLLPEAQQPLYLVDGEPFKGDISSIDANTIQSVTILKNDSAAQYAHLGDISNGVVLITLKSGDEPFIIAEEMPRFEGGDLQDFRLWVMRRIRFPQEALNEEVYGRVAASFVVRTDGTVDDIRILQSPAQSLSDEVCRVLALSPKWTPGKNNGEPVAVKYTIPVDFSVIGNDNDSKTTESQPAMKIKTDSATAIDELKVIGYK